MARSVVRRKSPFVSHVGKIGRAVARCGVKVETCTAAVSSKSKRYWIRFIVEIFLHRVMRKCCERKSPVREEFGVETVIIVRRTLDFVQPYFAADPFDLNVRDMYSYVGQLRTSTCILVFSNMTSSRTNKQREPINPINQESRETVPSFITSRVPMHVPPRHRSD
jgi:hypothetical protein